MTSSAQHYDAARLTQLRADFRHAWERSADVLHAPDLHAFLPPTSDQLRTRLLEELIDWDLRMRWQRQQQVYLERYLERFPELGGHGELSARLILAEYRARHLHGDNPPAAAYARRFPQQYSEFLSLLQGESQAATVAPDPGPGTPPARPDMAALPGYRLFERLGRGGFGEVFRAEAPGGMPAAVKILSGATDSPKAQRELRALDVIKGLRHPFLLATHAVWTHDGRIHIAMELADKTLADSLRECKSLGEKGIPLETLLGYFHEAAEAIDFLHGRGVLHRDIKPANLLLQGSHLKVADFGLAREPGEHTFGGSLDYMAPEVWDHKATVAGDQYSLAVTYVELRQGRLPFTGRSPLTFRSDETIELSGLEANERKVVLRALSINPEQRYRSCGDFVRALDDAIHVPPPLSTPAAPPSLGTRAWEPPVMFAGYKLFERIGAGSYGDVYRAEAPGGIPAAVKVLRGSVGSEEIDRELRSLEVIKNLRHPFLLTTQAHWVQEEHIYIAMELADRTLLDRLRECKASGSPGIPVEELLRYFEDAAEAIDYLHNSNVLHRDIKPGNMLLLQGRIKVGDFGLARQLGGQTLGFGTPGFMSPEAAAGDVVPASDQYSLAAAYAELRQGYTPFSGTSPLAIYHKHASGNSDLLGLPEAERVVVKQSLAVLPEDRFPSCRAFVAALRTAIYASSPPPPAPTPIGPPRSAFPRVGIVLALVGALGLAGFLLFEKLWGKQSVRLVPVQEEVLIDSGGAATVSLRVDRRNFSGSLRLKASRLPAGVTVEPVEVPRGETTVACTIKVTPEARAVRATVQLEVEQTDVPNEPGTVALTIVPLPPGTHKGRHQKLVPDLQGNMLYERLDYTLPDGSVTELLLVPKMASEEVGPDRSYYISRHKVSAGQFAHFAGLLWLSGGLMQRDPLGVLQRLHLPTPGRYLELARENHHYPALQVRGIDAFVFARLRANTALPTEKQWLKAAGYYRGDDVRGEGPYSANVWKGPLALWSEREPLARLTTLARVQSHPIAIGLPGERALPLGFAWQDVSVYGCCDLSGNGSEWTRTTTKDVDARAPRFDVDFKLLGSGPEAPRPWRFADRSLQELNLYELPHESFAFRIVVTP